MSAWLTALGSLSSCSVCRNPARSCAAPGHQNQPELSPGRGQQGQGMAGAPAHSTAPPAPFRHEERGHHGTKPGVPQGSGCSRAAPRSTGHFHVAGYALCLDMTARDTQEQCKQKGLPWTLAKGFGSSCPVSDFVPKEKIPDPHKLQIWLKVNGKLRQEGDTSSMIFSIPYLISYISHIFTLEEGDLILTGSPKGVGAVEANDEIEAGIRDVLSMRFKVVQGTEPRGPKGV
uniref:Oxaloacetate tautomerase FAHD1, mitochondrial n=1 Tax=Zonotrichia albicollis TaxID=44394 RepID=A0A8D2M788_ZONAL